VRPFASPPANFDTLVALRETSLKSGSSDAMDEAGERVPGGVER